ncbi:hypothetical protein ACHAW5_008643 [Stephanodiscus triporus]|uniref:Protein kinase domain-containing protein n=1 Tax=Stephanodiscus triporus TaxID=2934178 RepID=A0ABD3PPS6_9STRA
MALRIRLPEYLPRGVGNPPLDPPPFESVYVRRCVRITQRVHGREGTREVLILTSIMQSVDDMLNDHYPEEEDVDTDTTDGDEVSDDSEISSTSTEDCENEEGGGEDEDEDEGDGGEQERSRNQGFLEAFMVCWSDPIRESPRDDPNPRTVYYAKRLQKRDDVGWTETKGGDVAIKAISWERIRATRNRVSEDPVKEVAALQYLSDGLRGRSIEETHVLTADTVMCNDSDLYIVMPYCHGGDLCMRVATRGRFAEDEARFYFRQILKGLETLQDMRICHKDLSPENLILLENKSLIIDFGMCLRIPYSSDVRHLITRRQTCGKLPHISPEIWTCRPFDGHAVDIWAGKFTLFRLMLSDDTEFVLT